MILSSPSSPAPQTHLITTMPDYLLTETSVPITSEFRDIPRFPKPLIRVPRKRPSIAARLKAFLKDTRPELADRNNDTFQDRRRKMYQVNMLINQLNGIAREIAAYLKEHVRNDTEIDNNMPWNDIPDKVKKSYYNGMEEIACRAGIQLNRCEGQWGAQHLVGRHWRLIGIQLNFLFSEMCII
jgi:hypothetical protein